jgi:hypothetical protein
VLALRACSLSLSSFLTAAFVRPSLSQNKEEVEVTHNELIHFAIAVASLWFFFSLPVEVILPTTAAIDFIN